jgi:hypothetical protein
MLNQKCARNVPEMCLPKARNSNRKTESDTITFSQKPPLVSIIGGWAMRLTARGYPYATNCTSGGLPNVPDCASVGLPNAMYVCNGNCCIKNNMTRTSMRRNIASTAVKNTELLYPL